MPEYVHRGGYGPEGRLMRAGLLPGALLVLLAASMGVLSILFANLAGERTGVVLALPGLVLLGMLFLVSRETLFFLIIVLRSSLDTVLDSTKLGSFGLGAVLNALVILIAAIAICERPNPVRPLLARTWLPFLLIALGSLVVAPDFMAGLKTGLALVSYAAVFALAVTLAGSAKDYGKWMRAVLLSSVIPVAYGFVDAATGGFINAQGFRISSTFSHPNIFAFYLVLMISVSFFLLKTQAAELSTFWRRVLPLYLLLMLALLVMTKTRSAWAACFMFFLLYALLFERRYLLVLLVAVFGALMIPDVRDRLLDLAQGNELVNYSRLNSYAWRKQIWREALQWMEPTRYLTGYGLEAFKHHSLAFFSLSGGVERGAHSVYIQLLFETGALGLLAFIWLLTEVARQLLPFYRQNRLMIFSALMFLLEFAVDAYSDNMLNYLSFNWYWWFVVGAAFAVNHGSRQPIPADLHRHA